MDYRQAKKIREKSFGTLLAEQEGGIASSIRATISQRTKAKMTGMQEKFDPLNIAKIITGGSNWAPALLGKLTGRKQSSIDYFSGVKRRDKGTAERLAKTQIDNGDFLGILMSIESLLHKTREDDKLKAQEEKNFEEERNLEKQRRHKELISAITGKPYAKETTTTASKVTDDSTQTADMDLAKLLGGASALSTLASVISWFAGGFGAALLGVGSAAALMALLFKDKRAGETNKGIQAAGDIAEANKQIMDVVESTSNVERRKQNLLADRPSSKKSYVNPKKDVELQKQYLTEIGFDETTGLTENERKLGFTGIDDKGTPVKKESKTVNKTTTEITSGATTKATNTETEQVATSSVPTATPVAATLPTTKSTELPSQVKSNSALMAPTETPKPSQSLMEVQKTNLDLNLPISKPDPSTVINNNVNSVTKNGKKRSVIPLVRNNEETLQRLILNSTKVV